MSCDLSFGDRPWYTHHMQLQVRPNQHTARPTSRTKTYVFKVVIEPDEDRWFAYCPALKKYGATTWGYTKEEALESIGVVVRMITEELQEDGKAIPDSPQDQ